MHSYLTIVLFICAKNIALISDDVMHAEGGPKGIMPTYNEAIWGKFADFPKPHSATVHVRTIPSSRKVYRLLFLLSVHVAAR